MEEKSQENLNIPNSISAEEQKSLAKLELQDPEYKAVSMHVDLLSQPFGDTFRLCYRYTWPNGAWIGFGIGVGYPGNGFSFNTDVGYPTNWDSVPLPPGWLGGDGGLP